jgi:hypothetical protein
MRLFVLLLSAFFICLVSHSQVTIKLAVVSTHVGDNVNVCGKVAGIRYMENAKVQPTLINIGAAYPNQVLTVVISPEVRKQFEIVLEELFKDKDVCITGKIELYRDKPQIAVSSKGQIQIQK